MGVYRLVLAYMVVFSHINNNIYGYNIGIVAVISFLLLSGFVMNALIRKYYLSFSAIPAFYLDRFVRLAPQFYLYTVLTLIGAITLGLHHPWMTSVPSMWHTILQLSVVPLNFYRHYPSMLLPQAWSLGLEAMFYAVFPFVLIFRIRIVVALVSFSIFLLAYVGILDTDLYGYRYLPGTLFIFICGSWLESSEHKWEEDLPFVVSCISMILLLLTYINPSLAVASNRSVLLGLIFGIPIVYFLKAVADRIKVTDIAGDLSYGIFLNHNLIIGSIITFSSIRLSDIPIIPEICGFLAVCVISTILSYASFKMVEEPLIAWRRRLRNVRIANVAIQSTAR